MSRARDANWVDGLRGIAALTVVTYHICSSFVGWLNWPAAEKDGSMAVFQYPFLRLIVGGRAAISLFFFITGYVNSLRAMKYTRSGDTETALRTLSKGTFTRVGRLILPTNAALGLTWLLAELNTHRLASRVDAFWIRGGAISPAPNLQEAIRILLKNWIFFWHSGECSLDGTFWTIPFFLSGSMLVYLSLLATTFTRLKYRKSLLVVLLLYSWWNGLALVEVNIYAGMILAELNFDYGSRATSVLPRPFATLMILVGLLFASFPEDHADWTTWSRILDRFGQVIVPAGGEINRHMTSIGVALIMYGIFFSHNARRIASHRILNFLGRVSFPVYLLHNSLMRTVLVWLIYWPSVMKYGLEPVNEQGEPAELPRPGWSTFAVGIPVFYVILLFAAYLWTVHVDPRCEKVLAWMKRKAFEEDFDTYLKPLDGLK